MLNTLDSLFEQNELAYLSAQCKNELPIRDKIAWRLHNSIKARYGDRFVVRREWAPNDSRERVDLAILEMKEDKVNVNNVFALIEFKAQSIARREKWYCDEFTRDVEKMREFKRKSNVCEDADLYFVFLETGQAQKADKYNSVLGFSQYQTSNCVYCKGAQDKQYLDAIKAHWAELNTGKYKVEDLSISISNPIALYIGEAFGYKQYVSPLLLGPLEFKK